MKTNPPSVDSKDQGSNISFFKRPSFLISIALLLTTLVYSSIGTHEFVNWDDGETIVGNPLIRGFSISSILNMFSSFRTGNWIPLTWLSLGFDFALGGNKPSIYLWNNLILHLLNTVLVFYLARRLFYLAIPKDGTGRRDPDRNWVLLASFFSAVIFGIHPIHVESVAWASERKDVLYSFFYLSGLLTYVEYVRGMNARRKMLIISLILFLFALMSKPMAISFPVVLFILDLWPLKRAGPLKEVLLEKIVFILPALLSGWLAMHAQVAVGATPNLMKYSLTMRLVNGVRGLGFYCYKLIMPDHFSAIYPVDLKVEWLSIGTILSFLFVITVSVISIYFFKRAPYLLACWLYFVLTIFPVLGIVQIGSQAAADRYAYLPTLGFIFLFSGMMAFILRGKILILVMVVISTQLFIGAHFQVGVWKNSISLWENAAKYTDPPSEIPYWYLGFAYRDSGNPTDALMSFERSISINPGLAVTHYGKGLALVDLDRNEEAVAEFKKSISLDAAYAQPHINLSALYQKIGKYDEAIQEGKEAVEIGPPNAQAFNNLGVGYGYKGQLGQAAEAFQRAVDLEPDNPMYQKNLAAVRSMLNK